MIYQGRLYNVNLTSLDGIALSSQDGSRIKIAGESLAAGRSARPVRTRGSETRKRSRRATAPEVYL